MFRPPRLRVQSKAEAAAKAAAKTVLASMFLLCSSHPMSHVLTAQAFAPAFAPRMSSDVEHIPADLRIPAPPFARWIPARAEPAWREAMRWSLIGLSASMAAGEAALLLLG
jgi:hypothetical protein